MQPWEYSFVGNALIFVAILVHFLIHRQEGKIHDHDRQAYQVLVVFSIVLTVSLVVVDIVVTRGGGW